MTTTIATLLILKAATLLGFANPFSELFSALTNMFGSVIDFINSWTHNYGWSMLVLALGVRVALIPLYVQQLKSAKEMQALAPYIKRLQAKYQKKDPETQRKLQEETLKLYREHGVNPLSGCLPLLVQFPILIAVFYAIRAHTDQFKGATWLWIGSALSEKYPHIFATSLFQPDLFLLLLYGVSMYFSVRLTPTPSVDPQQAQMMKIQAMIMPIALFFFLRNYPSAFVLYWLFFNIVSMVQQWIVMRAPSRIAAPPAETPATLAGYPLDCPSCGERLVIVKGSKCEKCGAKVRKIQPSGNGAPSAPAAIKPSGGGAEKSS